MALPGGSVNLHARAKPSARGAPDGGLDQWYVVLPLLAVVGLGVVFCQGRGGFACFARHRFQIQSSGWKESSFGGADSLIAPAMRAPQAENGDSTTDQCLAFSALLNYGMH